MDFLYPNKQRRSRIVLSVGYVLIAAAIFFGTLVLMYQAYGFGLGKNGEIIQNGLVFVSSQPTGASIYLNGKLYKSKTNTRVLLPSGDYQLRISAPGYRDWSRPIVVAGGDVQQFDYPFLFPNTLTTTSLTSLSAAPGLVTQSPDQRWLLVEQPDNPTNFDEYDLSNPKSPTVSTIAIPGSDFTAGSGTQSWSVVEWSTDNHHVLLLHEYMNAGKAAHEYVMFDRQSPDKSVNVTQALKLPASETLTLFNDKYDQYYAFDKKAGTLRTVSLTNSVTPEQLTHILAYKSYGSNMLLYATDQPPTGLVQAHKVSIVLQEGQKIYTLRTFAAGAPGYVLNAASYNGDMFVVLGTTNGKGLYLYKNPQSSDSSSGFASGAWRFLRVKDANYAAFSTTAQFIAVENGRNFVVYDAENVRTFPYTVSLPLDKPQTHATWMDGDRLMYVSGGKLVVFDYDHRNVQELQAASPEYRAVFDPTFKYVYSVAPSSDKSNPFTLTSTSLTAKS